VLDIIQQPDYEIEIDPSIFNPIYYPHLDNMSRVQVFFGGASSGKSHFVIGQRVVIDLLRGGRNYMVCRQVGRTIKRSVFNQIVRTIADFGVRELFTINKTEFTITCSNGYQVFFVGLDDVEKIKSITPEQGVITDIIIEEATETDKNTVKALKKRQRGGSEDTPKRLVLVFNPILQDHWIYDEYFAPIAWREDQTVYESKELFILRTWFEHNKFLTEQDKLDLLSETDTYFSDVYTWGKFGVLGNVIFQYGKNWTIEDLSSMKSQFTNRRHGCDFGFASDPAAAGSWHFEKKKKEIYIYDELYERGFTNDDLATELLKMFGNELVICDSSEPKSIVELKKYGVNAKGAHKGQDSVIFGIQWLQGCKIHVDKQCINAQNELRKYKWKEDAAGKPVSPPQPVDRDNHFIDQLRYGSEEDMLETPRKGRTWNG
jgi:phage terminase large subunit